MACGLIHKQYNPFQLADMDEYATKVSRVAP